MLFGSYALLFFFLRITFAGYFNFFGIVLILAFEFASHRSLSNPPLIFFDPLPFSLSFS